MPLVRVDMMEGRPQEAIEKMITSISEAVSTSLEAPIETVRVVVNEMKPHQYGIGGEVWSEVVERRRRSQEEQT